MRQRCALAVTRSVAPGVMKRSKGSDRNARRRIGSSRTLTSPTRTRTRVASLQPRFAA
jgi:hypothetical protein